MRPPPATTAKTPNDAGPSAPAPALIPVDPNRFPRANPGPEPWPSPTRPSRPIWLSLPALALIAAAVFRWRRRRRSRPSEAPTAGTGDVRADPRHQLIVLSDSVRAALAAHFGPAWGSKTTEEVAADPALAGLVGKSHEVPLVRFLLAADRAKFADAEPAEDWQPWVASFLAGLAPRPAPRRPPPLPAPPVERGRVRVSNPSNPGPPSRSPLPPGEG